MPSKHQLGVWQICIATLFGVMVFSSISIAGNACCLDRVMREYDYCVDLAEYNRRTEASKCRTRRCADAVYKKFKEDRAECRTTRNREMRECNI